MRWRCSSACRPSTPAAVKRAAHDAIAAIQNQLAMWDDGAERLVRALARLGAAARRHRPRHHLRRDGRHQHGAWRDGDDRRLHDLRRAGADPRPQSRRCSTIRCSSRCRSPSSSPASIGILIERGIIRFLYGRPLETLLATWGLSLILQQAVRTVFGPTNREVGNPSWMSGAFEVGQHHHHLQPALDHRLHAAGVRRRCWRCCASPGSAWRCAR